MGVSSLRLEPRFGGVFSCPPRAARGPQGASRGDARDVRRAVRLRAQALYPRRLEDGARQSSRMRSGRVRWQRRDAAGAATGAQRRGCGAVRADFPRAQAARRAPPRLRGGDARSDRFAGCDVGCCRWNASAQRSHRSAIRLHVALLAGSRVNLAICWHSAACLRNSSDGFMGPPRCVRPRGDAFRRGATVRHIRTAAASTKRAHATWFSPRCPTIAPPIAGTRSPAADRHPKASCRCVPT